MKVRRQRRTTAASTSPWGSPRMSFRRQPSFSPQTCARLRAQRTKGILLSASKLHSSRRARGRCWPHGAVHTPCHESASSRTCKSTGVGLPDAGPQHSSLPGSGFVITPHPYNNSESKKEISYPVKRATILKFD